ncbi:MAG: PQQ-binding-like beta-propeller repeat protein [bacterium]|nr:PQQ-binding-like beta-propeller repeat protein [bacterium]
MTAFDAEIQKLKEIIKRDVLVTAQDQKIVSSHGSDSKWLFDFRKILLKPECLDLIAEIFWKRFKEQYPFQVGGQETAAIPLISAIVMKGWELGMPVNGFYLRKSRKKDGLQKIVEGTLNDEKIILVDDLINSGGTFVRQLEVLGQLGKKVSHIFTLMNFRDFENFSFLNEKNIELTSLISLSDFGIPLLKREEKKLPTNNFDIIWYFKSDNPNYFYVVPKSAPVIDDEKIYFGSDSGDFWALNQSDGSVAWKYKVGWHAQGKSIFSSPVLGQNCVYFGSYDGNVYALDTATGKPKWIFMEADWVGSSPTLAPDLNLLFIGLEFGLWNKKGGIVALDLDTGEKKWQYIMSEYVHCSPAYSQSKGLVAIGGNDSTVYLFKAENGELLWRYKTDGEIKASLTFDEKRNLLLFGSFDGNFYGLDLKSGKPVIKYEMRAGMYSTPIVYGNKVIFTSLDKFVYCLNLDTKQLAWKFNVGTRIFSTPVIIEDRLYVGANNGRLYEIDPKNGKSTGFFQVTERITNRPAYNAITKKFFLPTYANEIYCLEVKLPVP